LGAALREWLPRLVGIEQEVELRFPGGTVSRSITEEPQTAPRARPGRTATIHYVRFELLPAQVAALRGPGPVILATTHPTYREATELAPRTMAELAADAADAAETEAAGADAGAAG
jgi:hypothetical protein